MTVAELYPDIDPSLSLDFANVKALDPRVTFTRASPAVYYDGKTSAKAEENRCLYSQQFNSWGKGGTTVTSNTTLAPDSTLTADTVAGDGTSTIHFVWQTLTTTESVCTFSVYAKAGTNNFIQLYIHNSPIYANFDLATGTVGNFLDCTATMEASTNGFYRCMITTSVAPVGSIQTRFNLITSNTAARNEINTLTTSVILWGAQLEQRSSVTAYTPTTTQPITNYVPVLQTAASGIARFDHDPVTEESLGLLIEEQRTNLLLRSEEFNNAVWSKTQITVNQNVDVAPDGTLTADKVIENTANAQHIANQSVAGVASGSTLTYSFYAKAAERSLCIIYLNDGSASVNRYEMTVDLLTGTIFYGPIAFGNFTGITGSLTSVGNGWYRVSISCIAGTATSVQCRIYLRTQATGTYTGDGYSGIYIWGAQLEEGAFPTSYIKTEASQVIRAADVASMTGTNFSSWYRQDEGTFYSESESVQNETNANILLVNQTTSSTDNSIILRHRQTGINFTVSYNNSADVFMTNATLSPKTYGKAAAAYAFNDAAFSMNNATPLTDTSFNIPSVSKMEIGGTSGSSGGLLNGHIRKIAYYPKRLTNAQLQALTR